MRRWKPIVAGVATIWIGLFLCGQAYNALAIPTTPEQPAAPPSIDAIRELAELTVLEVEATEVANGSVRGRTGGTTVVVLVRGTVTLGVDLDLARFVEVDQGRRHLVLALPPPEVPQIAIDPHTSQVLRCERDGLWHLAVGPALEDQAITSALIAGQQRLEEAASRDDLLARARRHAEAVLCRFVAELGWTLMVRWEE